MTQQKEMMALVPRDGFFCKDSRGWLLGAGGRNHSLAWPFPATVRGALRTAWGWRLEEQQKQLLDKKSWPTETQAVEVGWLLPLRRACGEEWRREHLMWPFPSDARYLQDTPRVAPLLPRPPQLETLGRNEDKTRESLWRPMLYSKKKPEPIPSWWNHQVFVAWLRGEEVFKESAPAQEGDLLRRTNIHLSIDPQTYVARDSLLFSTEVVETLIHRKEKENWEQWALGLSCSFPEEKVPLEKLLVTLGGDRRTARVEALGADFFIEPSVPEAFERKEVRGLRLVVVTPAFFKRGWLPDGFAEDKGEYRGQVPGIAQEVVLRCALVPRPTHLSGWDMAKGEPKRTRRLVAPGAVYFFEKTSGAPFAPEEVQKLWLAALGEDADNKADGLGRVVPGVWNQEQLNKTNQQS